MPLYDPSTTAPLPPSQALASVHRFIEQCMDYADNQQIPDRLRRVSDTHDPLDAHALQAWLSYKQFLTHTLRELEDGRLDAWFDPADSDQDGPSRRRKIG